MPERPGRSDPSRFFITPLLSVISAILLSLSQPSFFFPDGLGMLAWIALIPLFHILRSSPSAAAGPHGLFKAMLHGGLGGMVFGLAYALLSQTWIGSWAILGLLAVAILEALSYGLVLAVGASAFILLPGLAPLLLAFLWVGAEYLRSQGSLAFPFGLLGLSQYRFFPMVSLASLGGVWLPGFFVAWFNALLATLIPLKKKPAPRTWKPFLLSLMALALSLGLALGLSAYLGRARDKAQAGQIPGRNWRIALVQHSPPRQQKGLVDYEKSLASLKAQSEAALAAKPDLIVWPESAIVPSLNWHLERRPDRDLADFSTGAEAWMKALPSALLYGNDLAEARLGGRAELRLDWNAAILLSRGRRQAYRKTRLVPFAEKVPAFFEGSRLASIARARSGGDWQAGDGPALLGLAGRGEELLIGSPICFEDCFGSYCAAFAREGADCLIVLTNDGWAASRAEQNQHLAQSVFRAAETGLPVLRSSSTGETASILPTGKLGARLAPQAPGSLLVELTLPARGGRTAYLVLGDSWVILGAVLALAFLLLAFLRRPPSH